MHARAAKARGQIMEGRVTPGTVDRTAVTLNRNFKEILKKNNKKI